MDGKLCFKWTIIPLTDRGNPEIDQSPLQARECSIYLKCFMLQRPDVAPPTKLTVRSPSLRVLADQKIDYFY